MSVEEPGYFILGDPAAPKVKIDWSGVSTKHIYLNDDSWEVRHDGTSTTADIRIYANDNIDLFFAQATGAAGEFRVLQGSTERFKVTSDAKIATATGDTMRFASPLAFEQQITCEDLAKFEEIVTVGGSTNRKNINSFADVSANSFTAKKVTTTDVPLLELQNLDGVHYSLWVSTTGKLRFFQGTPTSTNQDTAGTVLADQPP
jgi:hypothetical protein